ncbi:hypothetical protein [Parabacteroides johnsonii]|uniref:hypothetical protein n=1 Tax=Parabacteroides johnsonii TaxID=387661 RepID=UPI0024332445|nr:hypothetical protein [Parabacteroides johnsonii]
MKSEISPASIDDGFHSLFSMVVQFTTKTLNDGDLPLIEYIGKGLLMMSEKNITAKIGYLFFCPVVSGAPGMQQDGKKRTAPDVQSVIDNFSRSMAVISDSDAGENKIMGDIKIGVDFLYGGNMKFPCRRYLFPDMQFSLPGVELTDCHVLLTLFEEANTCEVAIECTVQTDSIENLIFMRQIFLGSQPFDRDGKSISQTADFFLRPFGGSAAVAQTAYLVEVNDYFGSEFPEEVLSRHANDLYGIMTGDEGYAFVAPELSEQRLRNRWSTRNFVSVIVFHNNFLLLISARLRIWNVIVRIRATSAPNITARPILIFPWIR